MPNEPWRQNPTSGSDTVRRAHTLVEGDSLASIAYAEYGDPAAWRSVAVVPGITGRPVYRLHSRASTLVGSIGLPLGVPGSIYVVQVQRRAHPAFIWRRPMIVDWITLVHWKTRVEERLERRGKT